MAGCYCSFYQITPFFSGGQETLCWNWSETTPATGVAYVLGLRTWERIFIGYWVDRNDRRTTPQSARCIITRTIPTILYITPRASTTFIVYMLQFRSPACQLRVDIGRSLPSSYLVRAKSNMFSLHPLCATINCAPVSNTSHPR